MNEQKPPAGWHPGALAGLLILPSGELVRTLTDAYVSERGQAHRWPRRSPCGWRDLQDSITQEN